MHFWSVGTCMLAGLLNTLAFTVHAQAQSLLPDIARRGAELYQMHCAKCHDDPLNARVPPRARLRTSNSPDYVLRVLTDGVMRAQASVLSADEQTAVVAYLIGKLPGGTNSGVDIDANRCRRAASPLELDGSSWNGWGGRGTHNMRYQPDPGLTPADIPRLKLKWAFAYLGGASSQPTIVGGRLFVPSLSGVVSSLDADSGCTRWATDVGAPVRTAISIGQLSAGKLAAYLGDANGIVHALDAETGKEVWRTVVEDHPARRLTGAPVLFEGHLYQPVSSFEESYASDPKYVCCSFRGSLVALDAATGRVRWKTYTIDETLEPLSDGHRMGPAGAAIWSAPTVDAKRRLIYAGTGNAYTEPVVLGSNAVIAFDIQTGAKRWVKQLHARDVYVVDCQAEPHVNCPEGALGPDFDVGSSPVLVRMKRGKELLLVTSKSGEVFGLDPEQRGKIVWQTRVGRGGVMGGIQWGGASDGERAYVSVSDRIPIRQPSLPGLSALSLASGALIWRAPAPKAACAWSGPPCSNSQISAPAVIPGVVFAGSFDGHVRAYAAVDGKILWDFDTGANFDGVNGAKATGGSIDQGGQTVAGGRLFVSSGARLGYPGNALLAFTVDGK